MLFRPRWGWLFALSIMQIIAGCIAIASPIFASLAAVAIFGAVLIVTAVLLLLSLGAHPLLSVTGNPLTQSTSGPVLPWGWLEHLPVVSAGLADRLSIVADGTAAAVLAFGIDLALGRLRRTSRSLFAVLGH